MGYRIYIIQIDFIQTFTAGKGIGANIGHAVEIHPLQLFAVVEALSTT